VDGFAVRPCIYQSDQAQLINLLLAYRAVAGGCAYPTVWRVRLLLTSRVWEPARDTHAWEDAAGRIVGFAMLWRRRAKSPYLVLDRFVYPDFASAELVAAMLQWGNQRAHSIATEQKTPLTLYARALLPGICPDSQLDSLGFTAIAPDPDECNVYFARSLQVDLPTPTLAPGYRIRPLRELDELEAYHSLYGLAAVNPEHQRELLASDEYEHLVVVDSKGSLAAYCECSICRAEWQGNEQHLGWIDYLETGPGQRRQGLGRAILLAGLARLREWGADTAMLVTISTNTLAVNLYEKTGFERVAVYEAPGHEKHIA
jgi:mycothiol synthase